MVAVDSTDVLDGSAGEPPELPDELLVDLRLLDPEIGPVARMRQQQAGWKSTARV